MVGFSEMVSDLVANRFVISVVVFVVVVVRSCVVAVVLGGVNGGRFVDTQE